MIAGPEKNNHLNHKLQLFIQLLIKSYNHRSTTLTRLPLAGIAPRLCPFQRRAARPIYPPPWRSCPHQPLALPIIKGEAGHLFQCGVRSIYIKQLYKPRQSHKVKEEVFKHKSPLRPAESNLHSHFEPDQINNQSILQL